MLVRMIINTWTSTEKGQKPFGENGYQSRAEIWRGDINLEDENEYLTRIVMIADGIEHPICDIPFAIGSGYWAWIPGNNPSDEIATWTQESTKPELAYEKRRKWNRLFRHHKIRLLLL